MNKIHQKINEIKPSFVVLLMALSLVGALFARMMAQQQTETQKFQTGSVKKSENTNHLIHFDGLRINPEIE